MSIGKWIIVAFVAFAAFIATLVTICMRQDISLVSNTYYQDELKYQQQIDRITNTMELDFPPVIDVVNNRLQVTFHDLNLIEEGEITLFSPSHANQDKHFKLEKTTTSTQHLILDNVIPGMYRAKMRWSMKGKEFFIEKNIYIL